MSSKPDHTPTLPHDRQEWITAQEYAAIRLCVPDSGTEWLDEMIRKALRDRIAGQAMQGWAAAGELMVEMKDSGPFGSMAAWSVKVADAMMNVLAERDKGAPE